MEAAVHRRDDRGTLHADVVGVLTAMEPSVDRQDEGVGPLVLDDLEAAAMEPALIDGTSTPNSVFLTANCSPQWSPPLIWRDERRTLAGASPGRQSRP